MKEIDQLRGALGAVVGFAISLGLPLAAVQNMGSKKEVLFQDICDGILVSLTVNYSGRTMRQICKYKSHCSV